jgi:3-methyladenine DNA glycosylase Tag
MNQKRYFQGLCQTPSMACPTTVYAFMQAMGLVNDHAKGCIIREKVERARKNFKRP